MARTKLAVLIRAVLLMLSVASCSSSSSKDDSSGGNCPAYGDLCVKIPLSALKAACASTPAQTTVPRNASDGSDSASSCDYQGPTGDLDVAFKTWAGCFHDGPSGAALFFNSQKNNTLLTGQTRHDVSGVGDEAFYLEDLSSGDGTLYVLKGAVLLYDQDNHISAPADSALPCLTEIMKQMVLIP